VFRLKTTAALDIQSDNCGRKMCCDDMAALFAAAIMRPTYAPDRSDTLNVCGFMGAMFEFVAANFTADATRCVAEIEAVEL
jgi:hypothetical protein